MALLPVLITLPMILIVDTWGKFAFITPFLLIPGYLTIGYVLYRSASRPVFDRKSGQFWKGSYQSRQKGKVPLSDFYPNPRRNICIVNYDMLRLCIIG
ncbi:hypothetical protein [Marinobacter alkaliphilus]|uniref:Uncharacterized protein n=1 Tax=Marinobacter alkaliphilus TaxID=254719 RepID=A0ABZ3E8Y0_9GAMM